MKYLIELESRADFPAPVREHHVQTRIAPWDDEWQRVSSCSFDIDPGAEPIRHHDGFGNPVDCIAVMGSHSTLSIRLLAEVETLLHNPFDYQPIAAERELAWISDHLRQAPRLLDFILHRSALTPNPASLASDIKLPELMPGKPLIDQLQSAMHWVSGVCGFDPENPAVTPRLAQLVETHRGSSSDLAHLLITVVRGWGVPARFAAGYVDPDFFEPDDDDEEPKLLMQGMRAWTDVLIPGAGWRGFDAAEGLVVNDTYVRVAIGRDANDTLMERSAFKGDLAEPARRLKLKVSRID